MERKDALAWMVTVCASLRLSQVKTLAALVQAALRIGHGTLANIGRSIAKGCDGLAKTGIQRVWRFTSNQGVEVSTAMEGFIRRVARKHRKKPLIAALDWTDIRGFWQLTLVATFKGRSIPLLWASYDQGKFDKSRNAVEEGLLLLFKNYLPEGTKVVILADRGFGRTELARTCQRLGLDYVIRIQSNVFIRCKTFTGNLEEYKVRKGMAVVLQNVEYREKEPVVQHVVIRWKQGLPKKRDEAWFLMTSLKGTARRISDLYGQRMTIEELFRDQKNRRKGFALRNTQMTTTDRLDRLVLILVLAYLILTGIGMLSERKWPGTMWCTTKRPRACSPFFIGREMVDRKSWTVEAAVAAVERSLIAVVPAWLTLP